MIGVPVALLILGFTLATGLILHWFLSSRAFSLVLGAGLLVASGLTLVFLDPPGGPPRLCPCPGDETPGQAEGETP